MILASGRATQESALKYMKAMFDMYQNAYRVMAPPMSPFEFMQPAGERSSAGETGPPPPRKTRGSEVDELKQRVAELEWLISNKIPAGKRRKTISRSQRRGGHSRSE